jgi:hypothetical protein
LIFENFAGYDNASFYFMKNPVLSLSSENNLLAMVWLASKTKWKTSLTASQQ